MRWAYRKRILLSEYNILFIVGTCLILGAMASWPVPVLTLAFGELACLFALPGLPFVRRSIDRDLARIEREVLNRRREELASRMSDEHRDRLHRMDMWVERIREALPEHDEATRSLLVDGAPDGLLERYIRLAIAYRARHEYLEAMNRRAVAAEADELDNALSRSGPLLHEAQELRIAIRRRRLERWEKVNEERELLWHRLAAIEEVVQLMHEQSVVPLGLEDVGPLLAGLLEQLDRREDLMHELADSGLLEAPATPTLERKDRGDWSLLLPGSDPTTSTRPL